MKCSVSYSESEARDECSDHVGPIYGYVTFARRRLDDAVWKPPFRLFMFFGRQMFGWQLE